MENYVNNIDCFENFFIENDNYNKNVANRKHNWQSDFNNLDTNTNLKMNLKSEENSENYDKKFSKNLNIINPNYNSDESKYLKFDRKKSEFDFINKRISDKPCDISFSEKITERENIQSMRLSNRKRSRKNNTQIKNKCEKFIYYNLGLEENQKYKNIFKIRKLNDLNLKNYKNLLTSSNFETITECPNDLKISQDLNNIVKNVYTQDKYYKKKFILNDLANESPKINSKRKSNLKRILTQGNSKDDIQTAQVYELQRNKTNYLDENDYKKYIINNKNIKNINEEFNYKEKYLGKQIIHSEKENDKLNNQIKYYISLPLELLHKFETSKSPKEERIKQEINLDENLNDKDLESNQIPEFNINKIKKPVKIEENLNLINQTQQTLINNNKIIEEEPNLLNDQKNKNVMIKDELENNYHAGEIYHKIIEDETLDLKIKTIFKKNSGGCIFNEIIDYDIFISNIIQIFSDYELDENLEVGPFKIHKFEVNNLNNEYFDDNPKSLLNKNNKSNSDFMNNIDYFYDKEIFNNNYFYVNFSFKKIEEIYTDYFIKKKNFLNKINKNKKYYPKNESLKYNINSSLFGNSQKYFELKKQSSIFNTEDNQLILSNKNILNNENEIYVNHMNSYSNIKKFQPNQKSVLNLFKISNRSNLKENYVKNNNETDNYNNNTNIEIKKHYQTNTDQLEDDFQCLIIIIKNIENIHKFILDKFFKQKSDRNFGKNQDFHLRNLKESKFAYNFTNQRDSFYNTKTFLSSDIFSYLSKSRKYRTVKESCKSNIDTNNEHNFNKKSLEEIEKQIDKSKRIIKDKNMNSYRNSNLRN